MLEKAEKERKSKLSFRFIPTQCRRENSRKIATKFNKLKNTVMASFQDKIGWEMPRKRQNKSFLSVPFLPEA